MGPCRSTAAPDVGPNHRHPQADTWTPRGGKGEQAGTTAGEARGDSLTRLGAPALTVRPLTKELVWLLTQWLLESVALE